MRYLRALPLWIAMGLAVGCAQEATPEPATSTSAPMATATIEPTAVPTESPETPRLFGPEHFYGGGPAIPHGEDGAWDAKHVFISAVVEHNDAFTLFYKGFASSIDGIGGIGIATSSDAFTWQKQPEPITIGPDVPYATRGLIPYSVLVEADGTWVMYFHAWSDGNWNAPALGGPNSVIGRATAPAPEGPWTIDPEPVLRGSGWASGGVDLPSVLKTDDGYLMIFSSHGGSPDDSAIGAATSQDGITWTMRPEPVLSPSDNPDAWDGRIVAMGSVVSTPQGYVMAYAGIGKNTRSNDYGLALSEDGLTWRRYHDNPVLRTSNLSGGLSLHTQRLYYMDNTYFLFFEAVGQRSSDIWLSVFEGDLIREP